MSFRSQQPGFTQPLEALPPQRLEPGRQPLQESLPAQQRLEPRQRLDSQSQNYYGNDYSNQIGNYDSYDNNYNSDSCNDCGQFDCSCNCYCPRWFVYAGVLSMDHNDEKEVWLSNDSGDYSAQVLGTQDAGMDWSTGYELRLGRHIGCSNWAWEVAYWGLSDQSDVTRSDTALVGNLDTPLDGSFQGLTYNDGGGNQNLDNFFNNAWTHRLRRSFEFHDIEMNVFQDPNLYDSYGCGCNFRLGLVAGLRYFKFNDGMIFSTDPENYVYSGDSSELHYDVDADNNLYGGQLGFLGQVDHGRFGFYAGTKFGLYANRINHRSRMYGSAGNVFIDNGLSPNDGADFNVSSSRNDISCIGEFDFGTRVHLSRCFSFKCGYRAVAITGVALSTDQIPQNFEDLQVVSSIQSSGQVILHGAYFGGEFIW